MFLINNYFCNTLQQDDKREKTEQLFMHKNESIGEIIANISELSGLLNAIEQCQMADASALIDVATNRCESILQQLHLLKEFVISEQKNAETALIKEMPDEKKRPEFEIDLFNYPAKKTVKEQPLVTDKPTEKNLEQLLTKNIRQDIRRSITLNDKFLFRLELFHNNDALMNETLNYINQCEHLFEVTNHLNTTFQWDNQSPYVIEFSLLLEKHFSQQ